MKLYAKGEERARDERKVPSMKVSCLGPEGSFSECAARDMCEGYEIVLCPGFAQAVAMVTEGVCDYAVLPVENSLNGGVRPVLDLLASRDVYGEAEYVLPIDHRLALLDGVREEDIEVVYSHEQALGQCAEYLRAHFPNASYVGTSSTSESLNRLGAHAAGIVGAHVKREGVTLSPENIADNKQNFTRFMRIRRASDRLPPQRSAMVFVCAVCMHKPGSLLGFLKIFQRYSLNLTRIESRPVKEEFGEYRFFIEFAGDLTSDRVRRALDEAKAYCSQFKLLGAYL